MAPATSFTGVRQDAAGHDGDPTHARDGEEPECAGESTWPGRRLFTQREEFRGVIGEGYRLEEGKKPLDTPG